MTHTPGRSPRRRSPLCSSASSPHPWFLGCEHKCKNLGVDNVAKKTLEEISFCFLGNSSMQADPEILLIPSLLSVRGGDCLKFKQRQQ